MSKKSEPQENAWLDRQAVEKEKLKFPPKNKPIVIFPSVPPKTQKIDGKYGAREMYILETNYGKMCFSATQFIEISASLALRGDFQSPIAYP